MREILSLSSPSSGRDLRRRERVESATDVDNITRIVKPKTHDRPPPPRAPPYPMYTMPRRCVGQHDEVAALVGAMVEKGPGHGPDFFTVDVSLFTLVSCA